MDLMVLMTLSLFAWRHNLKIFIFENLTKNSFNMQKLLLLSLTKQFLDRGANLHPKVQIGCKNSHVHNFLEKKIVLIFNQFSVINSLICCTWQQGQI